MSFRAALFDMDGTLIYIFDLWRGLLASYLKPFGAVLSEEDFHEAMSLPYDKLAVYLQSKFSLPKTPQEIMDEIDALSIEEYADRATVKQGVAAFTQDLFEKGMVLSIVTTNLGEIAEKVLKRFGMSSYFSHVYGTHELRHKKIFPECFLDIAQRIGVPPQECVVFEDSPAVAESAKAAGMHVVGILGEQTETARKALVEIADQVITSYYDEVNLNV